MSLLRSPAEPKSGGHLTRADQNTGGELREFPVRAAMHGKSRVSSVISVSNN